MATAFGATTSAGVTGTRPHTLHPSASRPNPAKNPPATHRAGPFVHSRPRLATIAQAYSNGTRSTTRLTPCALEDPAHRSYPSALMAKTREIKKRIKAVGNIRRITKTMQMIATAKFSAAQQRATSSKPYTETLFELVSDLASRLEGISHPLLGTTQAEKAKAGPELTLVITSDRGLCGPYNGSILRTAMGYFKSSPKAKAGSIELIGKKGAGFLKYNAIPVAQFHQVGDKPTYEQIQAIASSYIERFSKGEISAVRVIYMRFISAGKQAPTVMQLLPFSSEAAASLQKNKPAKPASKTTTQYEFSPDAESLLGDLLPATVKAVLFQAISDAIVSEQIARMVAMKSATDNAGKAGKRLTRVYNRARQAQITTELTEIISGAAALE